MSWYKTGTIAATNGSKIITGTGTQFTNPLNGVLAGRMLLLPTAGTVQIYEIESVQSDTQLTLVSVFTGTTGTGKAYAIPTSPAVSVEQFAHEFASTLAYYQQQLSGWQQILTGAGNVTLTMPDGQTVTVRSQQAWDTALTGKLTKGDYGIGGDGKVVTDANAITEGGIYGLAAGSANTPENDVFKILHIAYNVNSATQLAFNNSATEANRNFWFRYKRGGNWDAWRQVWHAGNLVKQTSQFDETANSLMINGAWGWGGKGNSFNRDNAATIAWLRAAGTGSRIYRNDTGEVSYGIRYAPSVLLKAGDLWASMSFGHELAIGNPSFGIRAAIGNEAGTKTVIHDFWTDKNLVKQMSSRDITIGSVLTLASDNSGSFGLGSLAAPELGITTTLAAALATARSGLYRVPTGTAGSPNAAVGWYFLVTRYSSASAGVFAYSAEIGNQQMAQGNFNNGIFNGWVNIWNSANLVKQISQFDATSGSLALNNAWGFGAAAQLATTANFFDVLTSNQAKVFKASGTGTGWPSNEPAWTGIHLPFNDGAASSLAILPAETLSGVRVAVYARRSSTNLGWTELWTERNLAKPATLDTAQTITGAKTFTQHTVIANNRSFGGTNTTGGTFNLGRISTGNQVQLGDQALPTLISGSTMPQVQVGVGSAYEVVDTGTAQTITGQKTFTASPVFSAASQLISIIDPNVPNGTVGRSFDISITNTSPPRFVFARRSGPGVGSGQQFATLPIPLASAGNSGNVLVTNVNVVADSNGFYKTASPVVKLFSNGTSELTSEAEGITTERLSEGVYRVSGCLGLNADRAWGGDDGGIDVPMCRNKLPRLWVDYGGDEGSAKINPDGSIVIRTYHRPHPDAPVFARNEIEGYANGDPIDIPHDTFISVRVQMPEAEVQEAVVETVANEVESDVVSETSAQA